MNYSKYDLNSKELVKSFVYSNSNNRETYTNVVVNGRLYTKFGVVQTITVVGNLYKIKNMQTGRHDYVLHCGVARQHPEDRDHDKNVAAEVAQLNAHLNPFIEMVVGKNFNFYCFRKIVNTYISTLKLKFIKTVDEINCKK